MDSSLYKDPENFEPSRYLDKPLPAADYFNVNDPYERDHFTYGAGRRVCPGVHVAEHSLYINIVRVLWGFNILPEIDEVGDFVEPNTNLVPGFLTVPQPFGARFEARSPKHANVIQESFKAAEKEGIKILR